MAKRPLARLATPASRPGTYSPGPRRAVGQSPLGGHLFANAIDLLALQRGDRAPRDGNEAVLDAGMAHFHETRGAPVERGVHLLAEAGSGKGQMVFRNQLTIKPGRAIAATCRSRSSVDSVRMPKSLGRLGPS